MKKVYKTAAYVALSAFLGILVYACYFIYNALPIGTGYSAKYLCSQVFLSDRDPGYIVREEIAPTNPLFALMSNKIDREKKQVTSVGLGFFQDKTALYREGFGCTLTIDRSREELLKQIEGAEPPFRNPRDIEWPAGGKVTLNDPPPGVNGEKLKNALDFAFTEKVHGVPVRTQAVIVVHRGRIIAERYGKGIGPGTRLLGWSMTKSITGALVGMLVKDGKLDVHKPAPIKEWRKTGDPRSKITLDNLMRMSSGLAFEEVYGPLKDVTDMLYGSADMAGYAAAKPLAHKPGTLWYYSSGTTNIIMRIVREAAGGRLVDVHRYLQGRLFKPLHMDSALIEPDASGNFVGSSYMFATARDWARMGLFYLRNGRWEGKQLLPENWIAYCTTPTPDSDGLYGAHLWLNPARPKKKDTRAYPKLPSSMYYLSGFNLQRVAVFPENDLVIVRMGVTHKEEETFDWGKFALLVMESIQ